MRYIMRYVWTCYVMLHSFQYLLLGSMREVVCISKHVEVV